MNVLENFQGYLQTDGYIAYEIFDKRSGITLLHCMAHARRHEALENDRDRAEYALEQTGKLYAIERKCQEESLDFNATLQLRKEKSVPINESSYLRRVFFVDLFSITNC